LPDQFLSIHFVSCFLFSIILFFSVSEWIQNTLASRNHKMYIALFSRSTPKHAFRSLLTRMYHQGSSPAVRASVPNGMPNIILHPWM
jgi:hypothetical protein